MLAKPAVIDSGADETLDRSDRRRGQQVDRGLVVVLDRALRPERKASSERRRSAADAAGSSAWYATPSGLMRIGTPSSAPTREVHPISPGTRRNRRVLLPLAIPP